MTWPALLSWVLLAIGLFSQGPLLIYLFYIFTAFGMLAIVPVGAAGGVNLLPQSVCALFIIIKIFTDKQSAARAIIISISPSRLGFLTLFIVYGCFTAYFFPRIFAGMTIVNPISGGGFNGEPLRPTTANITQSAYLILSCGMVLAFNLGGETAVFRAHFRKALFAGAVTVVMTGVLDMISQPLGLSSFLDAFRTASYALLADVEVFDTKRIIGLMSEASAFGATCVVFLSILIFLRRSYSGTLRDIWVPIMIGALLIMSILSTSSTAYLGLFSVGAVYVCNMVRISYSQDRDSKVLLRKEIYFIFAVIVLGIVTFIFYPSFFDPAYLWIDMIIFQKTDSSSYIERSSWTATALKAFFDTYGLGVGLGGARTSNWFVAILSNTGLIGSVILAIFLLQILWFRKARTVLFSEELAALRACSIPFFCMAATGGTSPDFGVFQGSLFGMAACLTAQSHAPQSSRRKPVAGARGIGGAAVTMRPRIAPPNYAPGGNRPAS